MDAAVRLVAKKPPGDLRRVERLPHLVAALRSGGAFDLRIRPVVPFSARRECMRLSVGVPGFVGGVGTLWERWGRLSWADVVAPARELLASGLSYDLVREAVAKKSDAIAQFPGTAEALREGVWPGRNLDLTLERLA